MASTPFFGGEVRLLTYIRPLTAASGFRCWAMMGYSRASSLSLCRASRTWTFSSSTDAGFVVVASAGNYGRDGHFTITSPGNSRKVITVGSLTDSGTGTNFADDFVSTYSSRGPTQYDHVLKPALLAPGNPRGCAHSRRGGAAHRFGRPGGVLHGAH